MLYQKNKSMIREGIYGRSFFRLYPGTSSGVVRIGKSVVSLILLSMLFVFLSISPAGASSDWSSVAVINTITGKTAYPGDTVEFSLTLESGYERTEDGWCSLQVYDFPEGWDVGFYKDGSRITNLYFAAGNTEKIPVTLRIKTPDDAQEGDYAVYVRFRPDEGRSIYREFVVSIDRKTEPNIEFFSDTPGLEISSSGDVRFHATLKNKYEHRITADLETENVPAGWTVEFFYESDGSYRLKKLSVGPGESGDFYLKVRPALNETNGVYTFTARAVPENGDRGIPLNFTVIVNNELEDENILSVSGSVNRMELNPGESKTISVTVRNTGDKTLQNINLRIQSPSGLTTDLNSFGNTKELRPGESWTAAVDVTARADAGSGTKEILIRAVSDETQSQDERIEVTIEKSEKSGLIGIGLIIAAVLFMGLIFLKFGRRRH